MRHAQADNKILKNYWLCVALLVISGVLVFFLKFNLPASPAGWQISQKDQSSLVLDFGKNTSRKFQGQVVPNMTVLEALYSASASGHFDFRYSIDKNGVLQIAKIGDATNLAGGSNWHFYLNGQPVNTGEINNIKIKVGDLIKAKYE